VAVSDYFPRQDAGALKAEGPGGRPSQELLDYWAGRASRAEVARLLALIEDLQGNVAGTYTTVDGDDYLTLTGDRYLLMTA
jgi:hypothetical protein